MELKDEIIREYKRLSQCEYSFMCGLIPIPDLTRNLMKKGFKKEEIHRVILEMYYMGEAIVEYGDKKDELELKSPGCKTFYYFKIKEKKA